MSGPVLPIVEVFMRPRFVVDLDPDTPVETIEIDSAEQWWRTVGGERVERLDLAAELRLALAALRAQTGGEP